MVAAAAQAVAVVVIRAVLLPAAVVLVVKIPADGVFRMVSDVSRELPAAPVDEYEAGRLDAPALRVIGKGGGIASRTVVGNSTNK